MAKSNRQGISRYSVGPFTVDVQTNSVMMAAGGYTLREPIIFIAGEGTRIEGVVYRPLVEGDSGFHTVTAIKDVAPDNTAG
jgi:hypothetical protein